jgi:O-antigen ligase
LIALVAALVMLLLFYPPRGFQIPIVILSLIIFAALLPPNYIDRLAELKDLIQPRGTLRIEERSLQGRLSENLTALEMIKSNPLFGVGLSSYNYMFPIYSKKLGLALVATEREAHNLYLEVAAETGIIGLSVLLLVLFYSFQSIVKAKKIFKCAKLKDYEGMVTGFMAGWVGYLAAAMYIHNAFPRYFYLLVGISLALHGIAKNTMPGLLVSEDAQ